MATGSPWPTIHSERATLADDLAGLIDEQWMTPSLCAPWTVRQVLGHMTATAKMTPTKFFLKLASSGFRFNAMTAREVAAETSQTPAEGLAEFRTHVNDSTAPPGPVDSWVADFHKGSNVLIGAKRRIEGLTLRATDADWSTGAGPEVGGPLLSLVLAMTGRPAALADLSGEG